MSAYYQLMTVLPAPSSSSTDVLEISDHSPHCMRCRYDLRGLAIDSLCPECGLRVARTLELADFCRADATWLKNMSKGTRWLLFGLGNALIFALALLVADARENRELGESISTIFLATALVGFAIGFYLITQKRDDEWAPRGLNVFRLITRWTFTIALPLVPIAIWLPKLQSPWADEIGVPTIILLAAGFCAALIYASKVAGMIHKQSLVWQTRIILAGLVGSGVILFMMVIGLNTTRALPFMMRTFDFAGTPFRFMLWILGTMLLLGVWTCLILRRYDHCFSDAATAVQPRDGTSQKDP